MSPPVHRPLAGHLRLFALASLAPLSLAARGCGPVDIGDACGGIAGETCAAGAFCDFEPEAACGAGDQTGVCKAVPEVCAEIFEPVCGCDGETHSNACAANAAGVSVASEGTCGEEPEPTPRFCGVRGVEPCDEGQFCSFAAEAECGASDRPGTCAPLPEACPRIYDPVCGCDGNAYDNDCEANSAGVSVASPGPCGP